MKPRNSNWPKLDGFGNALMKKQWLERAAHRLAFEIGGTGISPLITISGETSESSPEVGGQSNSVGFREQTLPIVDNVDRSGIRSLLRAGSQ
jgi:hypothetical protein